MTAPPPLLLHVFHSFAVGGAQTRFVAVANQLGPAFRHAIVAMDGNCALAGRLAPELDVSFPVVTLRKGALLANLRACRRLLRALRPDLLITSNFGTIEWALANLLPLVPHLHMEDGFGPEERNTQLRRRVLLRRLALRRSAVLLPSRTLLQIATQTWKLAPQRLHYVPNGVDLGRTDEPLPGSPPWPEDGLPVVGTVAVLRAEKNLHRLLRAFAKLALPARLVVVGDGPGRASLEALSQQLGLAARAHFLGHMDAPQCLYRSFDVFALSSDTEQMPLAVLEAMAASVPVASTDVGDVKQMVAAENQGFVVPLTDDDLAAALHALLADGRLRRSIGAANRARAESDYGKDEMCRRHRDLWLGGF